MIQRKPLIFPQKPKDNRRTISVLTVNASDISSLVMLLESLGDSIKDGEKEGGKFNCKWWINERKVDD